MGRPGGFKPPTDSLGNCDSIHLSYGRNVLVPTGWNRTSDLPLTRRRLCQLSYEGLVLRVGLEPNTCGLKARCPDL